MMIRLLCAHEMTKHVCKISHLNSKRLLRKLQKTLGGYFILPHPVDKTLGTATVRKLASEHVEFQGELWNWEPALGIRKIE